MSEANVYPVILCGGAGKRLWPASRKSMPKQFARINADDSLLQQTVQRIEGLSCRPPMFVTTNDYRFMVADQVSQIGLTGCQIVIEPEARNTGPSVCAAAELIHRDDPNALVLICPADHAVADNAALVDAIRAAVPAAHAGQIVTFGIRPDRPDTGYGYIELSEPAAPDGQPQVFAHFVEKPDAETASSILETGRYVWNSGIFLATSKTLRHVFSRHAGPLRAKVRNAVREAIVDLDFLRLGPSFSEATAVSIDYAIMENEVGVVVPVSAGWSDLGCWRSVWEGSQQDKDGVATQGQSVAIDCHDTLLSSREDGFQVVGVGLRNIAAVATRDAVLIADLDSSQSVGKAVDLLKDAGCPQAESFRKEFRPWGHYETIALGPRYQVKSIVVKPGGKLSLQSHVHRAEHWVVVEGTAQVTIGNREELLSENQSVYIPLAEVHRLANPGRVDLRLIEVQTGGYLLEDDIIRYEDVYDRV